MMNTLHKKQSNRMPGRLIWAAMLIGAVGMGWQFAGAQQDQQGAQDQTLKVGTYEPQEVFQAYHRTATFQQEMQQMQQEAGNDPQQAAQMQQQAQQMQQQLIQRFQQDIEQVMPEVAEETDVKIVAAQIAYQADSVEVEDITSTVTEKINEGEGDQQQESPLQRLQQQQQQQGQERQQPQGLPQR